MRVAIIGGGLSGTLACLHLLERFRAGLHITLIERRSRQLNRGVAYSAHISQQLLNVPAGRMGLSPQRPNEFLAWVQQGPLPSASCGDFLPRKLYGDFVHERFHEALERRPKTVDLVRSEAIALDH